MKLRFYFAALLISTIIFPRYLHAASGQLQMTFTVSMDDPASHTYQVHLRCEGLKGETQSFKLPAWTPGYYQLMDYAKNITGFTATDGKGIAISWTKPDSNTWQLQTHGAAVVELTYQVKTTSLFVATSYLDETRGYISPAGVFMYIAGRIQQPATITIQPYAKWKQVATGLDTVAGKPYTYTAPDFDILYDSPLLIGNLEELPIFTVRGVPHRFIGYQLGQFDREQFVSDLKKIVEAASNIFGDIPYRHYTFISIGPGRGGIEHLNSASVSFDGTGLATREGRIRLLSFIAHEYFHHYNVKRIRPIELGPFDYDHGSRTKQLWVSEGLSVYYEYMVLKRAGLITDTELMDRFRGNMMAFENKTGKLYQTLEQASYETWSDGPFGRTGDAINKPISYYDKGPVVGLLLDLAIQKATGAKRSLDDVMRNLYRTYYQQKKRGFTETEMQQACEKTAGKPLPEIFDYITTTKALDYPKYFGYAGLEVDTAATTNGQRSFPIRPVPATGSLEQAILRNWLRTPKPNKL